MLDRFYVPMTKPEDIIPHLVKRERHWKSEHSAQELALAWTVSGMPNSVRTVLETCNELAPIELIDGTFEKKVHLRTPGRNSQTDLMLIAAFGGELGIIAVEGKVEEPFGDLVSDWNDHSKGKENRLKGLCSTLGLSPSNVGGLRYQLLHRTVSAIYEAQRYRSRHAIMLVHSFSSTRKWFEDFQLFSDAMGTGLRTPNTISASKICEGVALRLAWVSDKFSRKAAA